MWSLNSLLREGDWPILLTFLEEKVTPGAAYSTGGGAEKGEADCELGCRGVGGVWRGPGLRGGGWR